MKKLLPKVSIALWMAFLVALGIYFIGFAPREGTYSEAENRTLASFPELSWENLLSGNFDDEIEDYLLDHFPSRAQIINAVNRAESLLSFATHDEYLLIASDNDDPGTDDAALEDMEALLAELNATEPPASTEASAVTESATLPLETEPGEYPPIEPKPEANIEDFEEVLGVFTDIGNGDVALRAYSRNSVAAATAVLNKYARLLPEDGKLLFTTGLSSYLVNRFVNAQEHQTHIIRTKSSLWEMGSDYLFSLRNLKIPISVMEL